MIILNTGYQFVFIITMSALISRHEQHVLKFTLARFTDSSAINVLSSLIKFVYSKYFMGMAYFSKRNTLYVKFFSYCFTWKCQRSDQTADVVRLYAWNFRRDKSMVDDKQKICFLLLYFCHTQDIWILDIRFRDICQ